jgi:hypothetical protein
MFGIDDKILAAICGLVGIMIGSGFNGAGFLLKNRIERRRIMSESLFNLIGLWQILHLLDMERFITLYRERLKIALPHRQRNELDNPDFINQLSLYMLPIMQHGLKARREGLKDRYTASISRISLYYPLLADELYANGRLFEFFDVLDSHFTSIHVSAVEQSPSIDINELTCFIRKIRNDVLQGAVTKLERDLKWVSWKSGMIKFVRCLWRIWRSQNDQEEINMIDKIIHDNILPQLAKGGLVNTNVTELRK